MSEIDQTIAKFAALYDAEQAKLAELRSKVEEMRISHAITLLAADILKSAMEMLADAISSARRNMEKEPVIYVRESSGLGRHIFDDDAKVPLFYARIRELERLGIQKLTSDELREVANSALQRALGDGASILTEYGDITCTVNDHEITMYFNNRQIQPVNP